MDTRTVEGPSEELWSLGSLVTRKTRLTRAAAVHFRARDTQSMLLIPSSDQS